MKKTMNTIMKVIGTIMALVSVFVGAYVTISTFMLTIFGLINKYNKTQWRHMIIEFFGLLTSEELDILEEDNEDFEN